MTIGSIIIGLALAVLVGLYISRPLLRLDAGSRPKLTSYQALVAQKEAILAQIWSLDFDYGTGKLTDEDYHRTREEFMVVAEDILRQLDGYDQPGAYTQPEAAAPVASSLSDAEREIEAAISRRRARPAAAAPIESPAQSPIKNGKSNFCPECGKPTDPDDKFCASCGHKLLNHQHV